MPPEATYYDVTEYWPDEPPVGMWFNYGLVDEFMREWMMRKHKLRNGEITDAEYLEWKLNWPNTCDDCEKTNLIKDGECMKKIDILNNLNFGNSIAFQIWLQYLLPQLFLVSTAAIQKNHAMAGAKENPIALTNIQKCSLQAVKRTWCQK